MEQDYDGFQGWNAKGDYWNDGEDSDNEPQSVPQSSPSVVQENLADGESIAEEAEEEDKEDEGYIMTAEQKRNVRRKKRRVVVKI